VFHRQENEFILLDSEKPKRKRAGYLWATDDELIHINSLIRTSGICQHCESVRSKADYIRVAAIVFGELLKIKRVRLLGGHTEKSAIEYLIKTLK